MTVLFDTGFLYSFFNSQDENHDLARGTFSEIMEGTYGRPIVLDYVFDELTTLAQVRTNDNEWATYIGDHVLSLVEEGIFMLFHVSSGAFDKAWNLFRGQSSERKYLSFTDCAIVQVARSLDIDCIASFDSQLKSFHRVIP